jgi:hypothetical protein
MPVLYIGRTVLKGYVSASLSTKRHQNQLTCAVYCNCNTHTHTHTHTHTMPDKFTVLAGGTTVFKGHNNCSKQFVTTADLRPAQPIAPICTEYLPTSF